MESESHQPDVNRGLSSSWEDVDDDEDGEELRQHVANLDDFCTNIGPFLDGFLNEALTGAAADRLALEPINARLERIVQEMLDARIGPTVVAETSTPERHNLADGAAAVASLVAAREAIADALHERITRELGVQQPPAWINAAATSLWLSPEIDSSATATSPQLSPEIYISAAAMPPQLSPKIDTPAAATSQQLSPECYNPATEPTSENAVARRLSTPANEMCDHGSLPAFLASLKPYTKGDGEQRMWCHGCDAPASAVPSQWSDLFHQTLHRLRSVVPPASVFADVSRTVARAGPHQVILVDGGRNRSDCGPMRDLRAYVDAELGVSEAGIRRCERPVYMWTTATGRRGGLIVGYLEVEPLTTGAHVFGPEGQPSLDDRRRPVKYGVARLWVAVGHRRRRIATGMLDAFRVDRSLLGSDIAFAAHEIQLGVAFVCHYYSAAAAQNQGNDSTILIYTTSSAWYK